MKKNKILHLTPHLGGGVGRVLKSFFLEFKKNQNYSHEIYSLDSINSESKIFLEELLFPYKEFMYQKIDEILNKIKDIDILIVHWWNHPLLYEFLVKYELPKTRVVFWSHVSGNSAPQFFTKPLLEYPNKFIFTTPISYQVDEVSISNNIKFEDIWATTNFKQVKNIKIKKHDTFNIGYVGTIDFSKLYPNFVELCSKIEIPNVRFIICGEGSHLEFIKNQVKEKGLEDKFIFTGFVHNIKKYLSLCDIFGYPLNKEHYGTCDQSLTEAMYSGIVPVVFNNLMESHMVTHMQTGIIVSKESEYIDAILMLYNNKKLREELSFNTKKIVRKRFSIKYSIKKWERVFNKILKKDKTVKKWRGKYSGINVKPSQIYLESLGKYSLVFEENDFDKISNLYNSSMSWKSETKGTINHYNKFFKDKTLEKWLKLNRGSENES